MTWKFDLLVESGQFLDLNEDELLELLDEPALNLDIREESNVLNEWLTVSFFLMQHKEFLYCLTSLSNLSKTINLVK
jgi:hypothetical protein